MPLRLPGLSDPSKAWEDGSAGGGELSSLRGPGHPPAVLFYFFGSWSGMLIWHEDKSGRVLRFRVRPTCWRLRDDHTFSCGFMHLGLVRGLRDKGLGHMLHWVWGILLLRSP